MSKNKVRNILIFGGILFTLFFIYSQGHTLLDKTPPKVEAVQALPYQLTTAELLEDTNAERAKAGLPVLAHDIRLEQTAAAKCADMVTKNYWAHDNPNGTTWESFLEHIPYETVGENLAKGFTTSDQITAGWMNSPLHRDNILKPNYEAVGFAMCGNMTVQHFADY